MFRALVFAFAMTLPSAVSAQAPKDQAKAFKPNLSDSAGLCSVEIVSGLSGNLQYTIKANVGILSKSSKDEFVVLKLRITNNSQRPINFRPWHMTRRSQPMPFAKSDTGTILAPWISGPASWPKDATKDPCKILPGASVIDVVAFAMPNRESQAIEVSLPSDSLGVAGQKFKFKINRDFFETAEQFKAYIAKKAADDASELAAANQKRKDAKQKAVAAAQKAADAAKALLPDPAKTTRANYDKLQIRISFEQVEAILGPGKEVSTATNGERTMRWKGVGNNPIEITLDFSSGNGMFVKELLRKRIIDD